MRNVDLRDWPGGEPDGLRDMLRERRWRVVRPGADRGTRAVGNDWPPQAETMVGLARLANVRDCTATALADGVPGDLVETGVWRGGTAIYLRAILAALESTIDALTHLEPLVSPGGFVIVDDYNGIDACKEAVTDHRARNGITADIHEVDWTAVWWRKQPEPDV